MTDKQWIKMLVEALEEAVENNNRRLPMWRTQMDKANLVLTTIPEEYTKR